MPTVTFTVASAADDGYGWRAGVWPPAGAFTAEDGTTADANHGRGSGSDYYSGVALFRWDTSSIPDDATILSASFKPWCHNRGTADAQAWAMVGDYYDFGGEPSVLGDWTFECSPSIFDEVVVDDIPSSDVRMDMPLTDLSGINKSGYTGIRCTLNNTIGTPIVDGHSFVQLRAYEHGSGNPAQLVVTYYVGTPLTFTIASAGDDGSEWRDGTFPPTGGFHTDDGDIAYAAKGTNYSNVALFRWDTSSIPDGATITEAEFRPYLNDGENGTDIFSLIGDYYDFGGEPSDSTDWTLTVSPSIFDPIHLGDLESNLLNGTQLSIPLTDLTGINVSGYTGIRCSLDAAGTPTTDNAAQLRTFEHTANQPAQLFVAYTDTEGSPVMWLGTN